MNKTTPILITGGAGYLGSHVCKLLSCRGYLPISFDNYSSGWSEAVKFGPNICGDIKNEKELKDVIEGYKPKTLIHLAAKSSVPRTEEAPNKYWIENLIGTKSVLNASTGSSIKRIVFASSCSVYGFSTKDQIDEKVNVAPNNPYSRSKYACEMIIRDYCDDNNINYVILRLFNIAGADSDGEIGEYHIPETHIVPSLVSCALNPKKQQFKLHQCGHDISPDGTCIRDYVHVEDVSSSILKSIQLTEMSKLNQVINIGSGIPTSSLQLLESLERIVGRAIKYDLVKERKFDEPKLVASKKAALSILDWKPEKSSIDVILKSELKWKNRNGTFAKKLSS